MSEVIQELVVFRGGIIVVVVFVLFLLVMVMMVWFIGMGGVYMMLLVIVESWDFWFEDGKNGVVLVYDVGNQDFVDILVLGSNGFICVVLCGFVWECKFGDIGQQLLF